MWRGMEDTVILYFGVDMGFLFVLSFKFKNNFNSLYVATGWFFFFDDPYIKSFNISLFGVMVWTWWFFPEAEEFCILF